MTEMTINEMALTANQIRQDIIAMLLEAGSGHAAGPLGMADVFAALYFNVLNHRPDDPKWPDRDRLVLSNGHICPVLYATLARAGYFSLEELKTLRKLGSRLQGHPHNLELPGLENSGGPLGQGLSQAVGMALSARIDDARHQIYCVMSDGEHDEGQTWEAVMSASKYHLCNLTALIDRNNIQIDGFTEYIMPLESLKAKYEAFNWHVLEVDGHNIRRIIDACNEAKVVCDRPTVIICHTIPGKGVGFMERNYEWHGMAPNTEQARKAINELRTMGGKIESEHQ